MTHIRRFRAFMKDGTVFIFLTEDCIVKKSQNERVLCMNISEPIVRWWFVEWCTKVVEIFKK